MLQSIMWTRGAFCSVCIFHNQKMHFYINIRGPGAII